MALLQPSINEKFDQFTVSSTRSTLLVIFELMDIVEGLHTDPWLTALCFLSRLIQKFIILVLRRLIFTTYLILSKKTLECKYVRFSCYLFYYIA